VTNPFVTPWSTRAHEAFKGKGRWRLLGASLLALVTALVLILVGPSRREVRERFEFPGAEGPLKIMPEISIDDGSDPVHQLPQFFRENPPPPTYDVLPEDLSPDASQLVPIHEEHTRPVTDEEDFDVAKDPDLAAVDLVELQLPQQTNPEFVLIEMVRPLYPVDANEAQRHTPVIEVEVAIFINEMGEVTAAMILRSDGGPVFDEVVIKAMNQWRYRPVSRDGRPPAGRWQRIVWRFKSPYYSEY